MNKSKTIILSLALLILPLVIFFLTGSLTNLAFAICGLGALLSAFGERIISRILMVIGALGVAIFGISSIVSVVSSLI